MKMNRKWLTALAVAGLTALPLSSAEAFFGFWPGSWFGGGGGFSFGFGGGWHNGWGHPWYGPGWGYRGWRYPGWRLRRWGYPGWGHYPLYGGYYPYALPGTLPLMTPVAPAAPVEPAETPAEK